MTRAALLALLTVLALAAPAAAAAPHPTGAWDFNGTLDRSSGHGALGYNGLGDPAFDGATIPGAPRDPWTVLQVPAGAYVWASPLEDDWWTQDAPHPSWTVAFLVRLDDDGPYDLLSVGDDGFRIRVEGGALRAPGETGGAALADGAWHQVVVVRDDVAKTVTAYVDGAEDLVADDPADAAEYDGGFGLFDFHDHYEPGDPQGGGHLARLRGWRAPLPAADVAGLPWLDTTPPTIGVIQPEAGANAGLRPRFFGSVLDDDGSHKWNILTEITLRDPEGDVAVVYPKAPALMYGPWRDWVREWPAGAAPLTRGVRYTAEVVATDGAGNETTVVREIVADDPPPQMVIHEPGAETADTTPRVSGWTSRWEGDVPWVQAVLLVPENQGWRGVSAVKMDLNADGTFAGDLQEVAPGDYTLRVTHVDEGARTAIVEQPLRVLAPARGEETGQATQGEQHQPPPPSGAADAGALRRSLLAALRRMPAGRFARGGARVRFSASGPGAASVRVLLGRRVVAKGRRDVSRAGAITVAVNPTATGRRALRRARRARLTLRSTFLPRGGRAATATGAVTLRR